MMARHVSEGISGPALICTMTEHGYDGWHTRRIVSSHVAESEHVAATLQSSTVVRYYVD